MMLMFFKKLESVGAAPLEKKNAALHSMRFKDFQYCFQLVFQGVFWTGSENERSDDFHPDSVQISHNTHLAA